MASTTNKSEDESFSFRERTVYLENMAAGEVYDLVIIGGGITGAGVARDAASRGMKVALVEAKDFAFGTSSRSTKLIHGGIRYLENLEFGLVFEALAERRLLFEMAPHLVHPLRFVLPLYEGGRVGMLKMGLGMWLYDALSLFEAPEMHQRLSRKDVEEQYPEVRSQGLLGAYAYSDAYMDDDRLVLETLRSAARMGAHCVNYVEAKGAELDQGQLVAIECRDVLSGQIFPLKGRHFISTVGPWTDQLGQELFGQWKELLRPTKGIHLTFMRDRLPLKEAVVMVADQEKRIVFAVPRHEMVIIGTTDTNYPGRPEDVRSEREDIDYLLNVIHHYFPGAGIQESDIVASYAGVRPLVDDGSETESKTSREHLILSDPRNITFVTGGKYTTYRRMAEETVQVALDQFPVEDKVRFAHGQSKEPLNPLVTEESLRRALREADSWAERGYLPAEHCHWLAERHGPEALKILSRKGLLDKTWDEEQTLWGLEALHAIEQTMCLSLEDFYLRRSPLFLSRPDHGFSLMEGLAQIFALRLSWDISEQQKQINAVHSHLSRELAWREKSPPSTTQPNLSY